MCRTTCVVYPKISQTLSYLEYSFARSLRSLNREDSDKYTLTITYTAILPYIGIFVVFMK